MPVAAIAAMEVPVMVADTSWRRLRPLRLANVPTSYGEILSEVSNVCQILSTFLIFGQLSGQFN